MTRVTFWNEFRHEKSHKEVQEVYPDGLHVPVLNHLRAQGCETQAATLDEPEHGLSEASWHRLRKSMNGTHASGT